MPSALFFGSGESFSSMRRETASVPSEPHSSVARLTGPGAGHERVDQIAADAARHLGKGVRDVLRLAPAEREQVAEERELASLPHADRIPLPLAGRG